jgi:hypothetical protein
MDLDELQRSGSSHWLTGGGATFGTIHRPVPEQPWRPLRMRIAGTGVMLPEVSVDVASREKLGQSMSITGGAGGGYDCCRVCRSGVDVS